MSSRTFPKLFNQTFNLTSNFLNRFVDIECLIQIKHLCCFSGWKKKLASRMFFFLPCFCFLRFLSLHWSAFENISFFRRFCKPCPIAWPNWAVEWKNQRNWCKTEWATSYWTVLQRWYSLSGHMHFCCYTKPIWLRHLSIYLSIYGWIIWLISTLRKSSMLWITIWGKNWLIITKVLVITLASKEVFGGELPTRVIKSFWTMVL